MQLTELVSGDEPADDNAHSTQQGAAQWSTCEQLLVTETLRSYIPEWRLAIGPARPELGAWSTSRVTITPADMDSAMPSTGPADCFGAAIDSIARMSHGGFSDPVQKLPARSLTSEVISDASSAFPLTETSFANYNWSLPHEALRHECMRLEHAADSMSGSATSFARFREYFETYVQTLMERHHAVEESVLAHYLVAQKVAVPSELADDHAALKAACHAIKMACQSNDLPLLKVAVSCFVGFLCQHMAEEEDDLLPRISAAFQVPWINDLVTSGSLQSGFARSPQSWCNTNTLKEGTTTATSISMAYEASKKWGGAPTYLSQLPTTVQAALAGPMHPQFVRRKESLLVAACTA